MPSALVSPPPAVAAQSRSGRTHACVFLLAACAGLAAVALHAYPLVRPWLFDDDFAILADSWTWPQACDNLWRPWNEHAMPLGRLSTWLLVQLAGRPTALPQVTAFQGPLAVLVGMALIYLFVRREMGHAFYGLVAMAVFGVSLKFNEAVVWFAASFAVLALDTMLLALLAAQRWRQTGRRRYLVLSAFWSALAPGWFAAGILAGPFCCLYLWPFWKRDGLGPPDQSVSRPRNPVSAEKPGFYSAGFLRRAVAALVPLLGTAAFLAVSLPRTAGYIQHTSHYGSQTAAQAFAPAAGLELTGRTVVDNLVFGINASGRTCPRLLVPALLALLAGAGLWWWRQPASQRRLMLLGVGLIFVSYWLIYSFRSAWPYEELMSRWTRYNLLPFLGLVFFLCGGLPSRQGTLFRLDPSGRLTGGQVKGLALLTGILLVLQFPLGLLGHLRVDRDPGPQIAALRQIEEVDARCRLHGISASAARQILEPLEIPYSGEPPKVNGWDYLRGSAEPKGLTPEEVRRLLAPI